MSNLVTGYKLLKTTFTVIFDACVLYPNTLRSLLMYLALTDLVRARWTETIQEEWIRNVLRDYKDIPRERLETTLTLMNQNVREGLVYGFEALIPALNLPDPDDRHVFAAAIHANAGAIITFNLKDFPDDLLKPFGIRAQHPDEFIAELIELDTATVCAAVRTHRTSLKNPPKTQTEFLEILEKQGLVMTAGMLREVQDFI